MTYDEIIEQLEITKSKIKEIARNEYGGESWNDDLDALTEAADIVADYSKATAQASEILRREGHRNMPRHHERIRKRGVYLPINTEPGADQGRIQSKEDAQIHGRQWTDRHGKRGIRLEAAILSKATI